MTKKVHRRFPGWDQMQVFWSYSVAFKKPRSRRLYWVPTNAQEEADASNKAATWMAKHYPHADYEELAEAGISKTYWRHWGGYEEQITKEEYEWGVQQGLGISPPKF